MGSARGILTDLQTAIRKAERAGDTRYAIAKRAGVDKTIIGRIMDAGSRPRLDIAERIIRALGYRFHLTRRGR